MAFIVLTVATTPAQPGECAFDNPPFGQQHKACAPRRASYHFQPPVAVRFPVNPVVERVIMLLGISPYHCQPRVGFRPQVLQHLWGGDRVIDGGAAHQEDQQQAQGIDADVAFASRELLAAVLAPLSPHFGGFHCLTIDTRGAWRGLVRRGVLLADLLTQRGHHVLPRPGVSPLGKILVGGAFGQQVVRQHVPLAAGAVEVQDGVDDFPHINVTRSPPRLRGWNQRLQDSPLLIRQVRLVGFARWGSHRDLRNNGLKLVTTIC